MKTIFAGLESSGKSLLMSDELNNVLDRNIRWKKNYNITRPIKSNLRLMKHIEEKAKRGGVEIIYWKNLDELVGTKGADIFIDEIGTYLDSRLWPTLSLDTRRWLAQADKSGVDMYGTAQDFAQIDLSFRRLVKRLVEIHKIMGSRRPHPSKPPVKRIWGLCWTREVSPVSYAEMNKHYLDLFGWPYIITRRVCNMFDTLQFMEKSKLPPLKHTEQYCEFYGTPGHICEDHIKVIHN